MEKYYMAALGGAEGFGNKSIALLVKHFGSAKVAWSADVSELLNSGVRKNSLGALIAWRKQYPNAPENLISYCDRQKINLCCIADADYPPILKEIDSPPMFFYYRGKLQTNAQRIAIVGSRKNTAYGESMALKLGEKIAATGLTIVSGAARGIDTYAHRGALKAGRTVAVLGSGIDCIFPRENKKLCDEIAERGVVMSELPPQMPPNHGTFPQRNRIIAGLCRSVVIVEASTKSGSVMTANLALKYGRKLFAVSGSEGCDMLIQNGAIQIDSARDMTDSISIKRDGNHEKENNNHNRR